MKSKCLDVTFHEYFGNEESALAKRLIQCACLGVRWQTIGAAQEVSPLVYLFKSTEGPAWTAVECRTLLDFAQQLDGTFTPKEIY